MHVPSGSKTRSTHKLKAAQQAHAVRKPSPPPHAYSAQSWTPRPCPRCPRPAPQTSGPPALQVKQGIWANAVAARVARWSARAAVVRTKHRRCDHRACGWRGRLVPWAYLATVHAHEVATIGLLLCTALTGGGLTWRRPHIEIEAKNPPNCTNCTSHKGGAHQRRACRPRPWRRRGRPPP